MTTRTLVRTGVVLVTLLAVALGGSVYLPAQVLLAALAGLFLLLAPPRGPLPRTPLILAALLVLISLLAFLPAGSMESTPWRKYLVTECHLPLPIDVETTGGRAPYVFPLEDTRSPQPWMTLQGCGLLVLGLSWGLYLLNLPWERKDRVVATETLVFGVSLLALTAALAFLLGFHIPGWTQAENRGWFPNRNQTADVLALCGIVNYALIFDRFRKGKRVAYLLLAALIPIVTLLVISLSRAGILLFFGGLLVYHLWPRGGTTPRRGSSAKWLALSAALGLILLALFLAWGGDTLKRFELQGASAADVTDFRGAIQKDAFWFSLQAPWAGTGLGNFQPLFSFSRSASINSSTAIHPESDWLWLACEMGWPAVIVVMAGYGWWLRRALPLENKSGESMRRALIVAVIVFAVHGLVDVSGHRPGSLFVALLIAGMALPVRADERASRITPVVFRSLGVVLLLLAGWWGGSLRGWPVPPTTGTLARLMTNLQPPRFAPDAAARIATDALRIAPLDWTLYFRRGAAEVTLGNQVDAAQADFAAARALNPFWYALSLEEGQIWINANEPDLAVDAWADGLHRAGPMAPEAYREMVGRSPEHSIMRQDLAALAFDRNDYLLALLPTSDPNEAEALIDHLLEVDRRLQDFNAAQRAQLFDAWWAKGDPVQMMEIVHEHPEWDSQTWSYQARFAARENDFHAADDLAAHWVRRPAIPQLASHRPLADLTADFKNDPASLPAGLELFFAQVDAGDPDDALATLHALEQLPHRPAYLAYLAAQLNANKGDWAAAWSAWQDYLTP
jgi:hypothetical protein